MIEINLLPEELRKVEGTPPARLLVIILSVIIACFMGVIIGNYYLLKIPQKQNELANTQVLIDNLKLEEKAVEDNRTALTNLVQKVKALDNLSQTRVLYGRLLTRFWQAVPQGVWIRSFAVTDESSASPNPSVGKRYQMTFGGYTTGDSDAERDKKVTDFMNNLRLEFEVAPEGKVQPQPLPADYGFNPWNNARFYPPHLGQMNKVELPVPTNIDPAVKDQIPHDKTGLDFQMTMSFELPAPVN